MGTNKHASDRAKHERSTPPRGPDRLTDQDRAMRAGKHGTTQHRADVPKEAPTRDEGRDDRRSGSDH
jgi:hypothetical protein